MQAILDVKQAKVSTAIKPALDALRAAPPPLALSLLMWGLAAAFYLFGFFQRVTPAALADALSRELAPTATS